MLYYILDWSHAAACCLYQLGYLTENYQDQEMDKKKKKKEKNTIPNV